MFPANNRGTKKIQEKLRDGDRKVERPPFTTIFSIDSLVYFYFLNTLYTLLV